MNSQNLIIYIYIYIPKELITVFFMLPLKKARVSSFFGKVSALQRDDLNILSKIDFFPDFSILTPES